MEFTEYNNKVCKYVGRITFLLTFLKDQPGERPGGITVIDLKKMTLLQMWRAAQMLGEEMAEWEKYLEGVKDKVRDAEIRSIQ